MTDTESKSAPRTGISIRDLLGDPNLGLTVRLVAGKAGLDRRIAHARIQKSGLVFVGHRHGLIPERVQILGDTELSYLHRLPPPEQTIAANHLFALSPGLVLVTRGTSVPEPFLRAADHTGTPVAVALEETSAVISAVHTLLDEQLAPRARLHGVLVDVYEIGVLLLGKSGIGKSECALDLVQRGHRLVADDVIECDYRPPGMVFGEAAPLLRHHIEVRGLGILDLKELFGVTAIRERKRIDIVVQMEEGGDASIDRLGLEGRTREILGVRIREVVLMVRPGRNASSIIEMAARNELLRGTGKDSSVEFVNRLDRSLVRRSNESGAMQAVVPVTTHSARHTPGQHVEYDSSFPNPVVPKGGGT